MSKEQTNTEIPPEWKNVSNNLTLAIDRLRNIMSLLDYVENKVKHNTEVISEKPLKKERRT